MVETPATASLPGYASIMVPVDLSGDAIPRISAAGEIADKFSSHLIGIASIEPYPPTYGSSYDQRLADIEKHQANNDLASAEAVFRRVVGKRSSIEWRSNVGNAYAFLLTNARVADLIVLTRSGSSDQLSRRMIVNAGDAVIGLGRPVVVVPPNVTYVSAKRIVVAWKNTREARRAVLDGLPFLKRAKEVIVVAIGPDADQQGAADVDAYLCRCDVASRAVVRLETAAEVAGDLVRFAESERADLIISGAYGHGRLQERIFGGVTRDLLEHSPVSCLMSH